MYQSDILTLYFIRYVVEYPAYLPRFPASRRMTAFDRFAGSVDLTLIDGEVDTGNTSYLCAFHGSTPYNIHRYFMRELKCRASRDIFTVE